MNNYPDLLRDFREAEKRADCHPFQERLKRWSAFQLSTLIHSENFKVLESELRSFANDPMTMLKWGVDNKEELRTTLRLVTRRLHNYLASSASLVDHTRILKREVFSGDQVAAIDLRIGNCFGSSEVSEFLKNLRNYALHYTIPVTQAQMSWHRDENHGRTVFSINLVSEPLRAWDGWGALAKAFLSKQGEQISLLDTLLTQQGAVDAFNDWLNKYFLATFKQPIRELQELRRVQFQLGEAVRTYPGSSRST